MTGPVAALLPCGARLHLQHGPIDLIVSADGARQRAFEAARARFASILTELMEEIELLRQPVGPGLHRAQGSVARRMQIAAKPLALGDFLTPMAAVAGAVADEVLAAMTGSGELARAYVNNGGDIALHLAPGESLATAMLDHQAVRLGQVRIGYEDPVRGIATSGRHGRSLSLGIADSVTVLARSAAEADAAATLIANAVDLPDHPAITRRPACELRCDSDLGERLAVTDCGALAPAERGAALRAGLGRAADFVKQNKIIAASLHLQGETMATTERMLMRLEKEPDHA